ncbi:MAG: glutathione S-transferase [Gammaproteobacteria bacterium]|jgi:glutathione S-transferase
MSKSTGKTHEKPILWGAPGSGYTGRIRSYLLKKGVDHQQIFPGNPRFHEEIIPLIGYFVMPVMELTDGTLIQDSTDTLLYFEQQQPENSLIPESPQQRAIAWLLAFFGSEMVLKIGMHYRWTYLDDDRSFAEATFAHFFSHQRDRDLQRKDVGPIMAFFDGFLEHLAVTKETIPAIEESYLALLDGLNAHFLQWPYLLGGRPSPADFGLVVMMFAHLSRDPTSSQIMKQHAPQVYRWTERMFEIGIVDGEFADFPPEYMANDTLPDTLLPVLRYFFEDNGPEILGMVNTFNAWCDSQTDLKSGTPLRTDPDTVSAHPMLGSFTYESRGATFHRQTFASALYCFQRALDEIELLEGTGRERFEATMKEAGGMDVAGARLRRRIRFEDEQYTIA